MIGIGIGIPYKGAHGGIVPFLPSDLSNLGFWLKADLGVTFDGTPVVTDWNDQSSNAYHVTQATGADQPDYIANSLNGLPGVDFDGASHFLERDQANAFNNSTGTLFMVVSGLGASVTNAIFGVSDSTNIGNDEYSQVTIRSDRLIEFQTRTGGIFDALRGTTTLSGGRIIMLNSDGSTVTGEIDGVSETLNVTAGANNGNWFSLTASPNKITVGALQRDLGISQFFNGILHEKILYDDEKTVSEILQVTNYLKTKWAI